jgi:hypothetical protein
VRQPRDAHLECHARDATKLGVVRNNLVCDRFRIAHKQRAAGGYGSVEVRLRGWTPAALFADFIKTAEVTWRKVGGSALVAFGNIADGVNSHGESLRSVPLLPGQLRGRDRSAGENAQDFRR